MLFPSHWHINAVLTHLDSAAGGSLGGRGGLVDGFPPAGWDLALYQPALASVGRHNLAIGPLTQKFQESLPLPRDAPCSGMLHSLLPDHKPFFSLRGASFWTPVYAALHFCQPFWERWQQMGGLPGLDRENGLPSTLLGLVCSNLER